jgi:hypothetical protein
MGLVNLSSILVSDIVYRNVLWKAMNTTFNFDALLESAKELVSVVFHTRK